MSAGQESPLQAVMSLPGRDAQAERPLQAALGRIIPQPAIAAASVTIAVSLQLVAWVSDPVSGRAFDSGPAGVLTVALVVGLLLAYQFPIHIRLSSKVYMSTAVYFLMAALLPPAVAVGAAGIGTLVAELSVRSRTGNLASDMATTCGRVVVMVCAGTALAHAGPSTHLSPASPLIASAVAMLILEHLTAPALFCPMTGEPPIAVIRGLAREGGLAETSQYLIGLLGAFAAHQEIASLALLALPAGLVHAAFKRAKDLDDRTRETLESIADTVDLRDPYTGGHSRRVTEYTRGILAQLDKSGPEVDLVVWAARVHDIGKIAIPDGVLNKPANLTEAERAIMESHSEKGAEFLRRYPQFARGVEIVLHHHERWDGDGYPHGIRGASIPFGARVIAVADSFDAMTSDRPYRSGMPASRAAAILDEGRGTQWDGAIVDAFLRSIEDQLPKPAKAALRALPQREEFARAATA